MSEIDLLMHQGQAALAAGDPAEAVRLFARAILLEPRDGAAHANIAAAYLARGQAGEALAHAERAVRLQPGLAAAHHNLGNARFTLGDAVGALAAFRAARDLDPQSEAHWANILFTLAFAEGVDGAGLFAENRAWGRRIEDRLGAVPRPRPADGDPERPLRIAYVLPELDAHVTPRFVAPLLAHHDYARFAVSIYGDRLDGGARPAVLTHDQVAWVDTRGLDAAALARRMRDDRIDVLIHPCTFKARYRLVLAHRAAPLQIAAINLTSTTGLTATDAIVGDAIVMPATDAPFFTETIVRLPVFNTYRAPERAPEVNALPASRAGFVRFGSFNNPAKVSASTVRVWANVLRRIEGSRILLKHRAFDDAAVRAVFVERFAEHGIAAARLEFAGFTAEVARYLAAYQEVDIALDPMPFSGGTTSYEAIWMGVPVLTLAGATPMARQSASFMHAVGRREFVALSEEDYVARAERAARDLSALADVRATLRETARSSLFDAARMTGGLEEIVRALWRDLSRRNFP